VYYQIYLGLKNVAVLLAFIVLLRFLVQQLVLLLADLSLKRLPGGKR
jgi:hypothetical protein